jgi:Asp-tRNA(Asn)/Glu-tRNA(Gln) amidotransferase A subunit family amidase
MADGAAARTVERALAAIAAHNGALRAITHYDPSNAGTRAALIDAAPGEMPLLGLSFVAKDLIDVAGLPTSCGSGLFDTSPAAHDAVCILALQKAGAVVMGKSNMHELAVGSAQNPWFGQVVNPLSARHGTGGTSSGTAAAVAAGLCDFGLGTDSGGSNRSTAAATGLFGLKPTNGLLALEGVRPVAPTLDTVGVLARDAATLARGFSALSGTPHTPGDTTLEGRVIGLPAGLYGQVDSAVQEAFDLACQAIQLNGGRVIDFAIDDADALSRAGKHILQYEFVRHHGAAIEARPERVGVEILAFTASAKAVSARHYEEALALVESHRAVWARRMADIDALLAPVAPGLAPRLADEHTRVAGHWVPYGAAGAQFRMWANTIGLPAIAIPVARPGGLPASVQLVARPLADGFLIGLAAALGREMQKPLAATTNKGVSR